VPQIFSPRANVIAKAGLVSLVPAIAVVGAAGWTFYNSPYVTDQYVVVVQPIPFSHEHHVGRLGFDCRYCHTAVEKSPFAGIPPTETCMNCHSQIWAEQPMLAPVRESFKTGQPLVWHRVHNLPDFAYFDHHVHLAKGIGCVSCHGRIDQMPLVYQAAPLTMSWCLDCHRNPEPHLRPREEVFNMDWTPPPNADELRARLMEEYGVERLTSCSTCHR